MDTAVKIRSRLHRALQLAIHPAASCGYLLLFLVPLLQAGRYNHPSGDDYSNSVWTDFAAYQHHLYFGLTGRFFSSIAVSLNPIRWGSFEGYKIAAAVLISTFVISFAITICMLLNRITTQPFRLRWFLSVAATFVTLNGAPSLAEGLYWFTGSMTYTLPVIMLCWAVLIGLHMEKTGRATVLLMTAQGILVAGATGCNEVIIMVIGAMTAAGSRHHYKQGQLGLARWYAVLSGIWLLAAVAAIGAPGNYVRQALQTRETAILLPTWLYFSKDMFLEWVGDPVFMAFSLLFIWLAWPHAPKIRLRTFPAILLALGIIAVVFFPACWGLGRMPPWRVRNVAFMLFVPAWMLALTAAANGIRRFSRTHFRSMPFLRSAAVIGSFFLLLTQFRIEAIRGNSNFWQLAKNFRKKTLVNFDAENLSRYELLRRSPLDTVVVPRLKSLDNNIVFFSELDPDPTIFPNVGVAQYFGKKLVVLQPDSVIKR